MTERTRATSEALNWDAYFPDESGIEYPHPPKLGAHLNKYTRIFVQEAGQLKRLSHEEAGRRGIDPADQTQVAALRSESTALALENPLDPSVNPRIKFPATGMPRQAHGQRRAYAIFVPEAIVNEIIETVKTGRQGARPVEVVLWFGVGSELNRHGLRNFFTPTQRKAIIIVPGVEPGHGDAFGGRWGIGITQAQVARLMKQCFGNDIPWVISQIYAFSTGYLGLIGTLRNELIELRNVRRLIFLDCLYPEGGAMQAALSVVHAATHNMVKIVTYVASEGGTPGATSRRLHVIVPHSGIVWLFGQRDYQALTHGRVLQAGLHDRIIGWTDIEPGRHRDLQAFFASLPTRGSVVSNPQVYQYLHGRGPSDKKVLSDWFKSNSVLAERFLAALWMDSKAFPALVRLIWEHGLPGWYGGSNPNKPGSIPARALAEGTHDFLPFEFVWESLI